MRNRKTRLFQINVQPELCICMFEYIFQAKEDDFEKFDCVAFINAAENLLTLGKGLHCQKTAFQAGVAYACLKFAEILAPTPC